MTGRQMWLAKCLEDRRRLRRHLGSLDNDENSPVLDIAKGKMRVSFGPSGIDTGESVRIGSEESCGWQGGGGA
jgi:hypothetical protein